MTLQVSNLSVSYGRTEAVKGISFEVPAGDIVGIVGPNGAGKTTTLNAIGGLVEWEGTMTYDGEDLSGKSTRDIVQMGVGYATEEHDLFPYFTVRENLVMGRAARQPGDREERFELVYDIFPRLEERTDQEAGTLSGGEQQMLAIGRTLMSDPEFLIIDEPTLGLAPVIVEDISAAFDRLNEVGTTILLVEQNSAFAIEHSDHLYLLENGEIRLEGTPEAFKNNEYVREIYVGIT